MAHSEGRGNSYTVFSPQYSASNSRRKISPFLNCSSAHIRKHKIDINFLFGFVTANYLQTCNDILWKCMFIQLLNHLHCKLYLLYYC